MKGRENQRGGSRRTEKKGNLGSVRREVFAAGRRWRSKTQAFCRTLSRLLTPLGGAPCKKSLDANPGFLFEFGGERGLDSLRSPCGPPLAVQNAGVLSNPVEASRPSRRCTMQKKAWTRIQAFSFEFGGERGVRTLDTLSRIHTFQACSFSHSDTSPFCCRKRFALSTGANVGESDLSVNPLISFS